MSHVGHHYLDEDDIEDFKERLSHMKLNHYRRKEDRPDTDESVYFHNNAFPHEPSHMDLWFQKYCFEVENYDPFTGSKMLPKKTPPSFKKKSKAYEEFKSLVSSKRWISPDSVPKLPATEDDEEFKGFLEKYHSKRSQLPQILLPAE